MWRWVFLLLYSLIYDFDGSKNVDRKTRIEIYHVKTLQCCYCLYCLYGLKLKWISIHHEFRSICFPSNKNGFKFSNRVHEDGWMGPYLIRMKFLTLLLNDVSSAHVHIFVRKIFRFSIFNRNAVLYHSFSPLSNLGLTLSWYLCLEFQKSDTALRFVRKLPIICSTISEKKFWMLEFHHKC